MIAITGREPFLDPCRIHFHADEAGAIHGCSQWLGSSHSTEAAANDEFAGEIPTEMFLACRAKGLECALHNSLAADVNPGTSGHLSIHR